MGDRTKWLDLSCQAASLVKWAKEYHKLCAVKYSPTRKLKIFVFLNILFGPEDCTSLKYSSGILLAY